MKVDFEVSSASALEKWIFTLNDAYNKDNIVRIVNSLPFWGEGDEVNVGRSSLTREFRLVTQKKTAATKADWLSVLAKMFTTEHNRRVLWEHLSDDVRRLMEYLNTNVFISGYGIRTLLDISPEALPPIWWLSVLSAYSPKPYYYMPVSVIGSFPSMTPPPVSDYLVEDLDEAGLLTADPEHEMITSMSVLQSLYDSDMLERGKSRVSVSYINKVAKMLRPMEFYKDSDDKNVRSWRTLLLVNAYVKMRDSQPRQSVMGPVDALKQIFQGIALSSIPQCGYLAKILFSKLNSALTWDMSLSHLFKTVISILKTHAADGSRWLLTDGLMAEIDRAPGGKADRLFFVPESVNRYSCHNNFSQERLQPDNLTDQAGKPMIDTLLSLLCSLGFLVLKYRDEDPVGETSPMPFIAAMRLTSLGRYVMGLDESYQARPGEIVQYFELDAERLIIRALGDDNPYEGLLKEFANPIGARRYVVTPETFLSRCRSVSDVNSRLELFRQTVAVKLPPNWEEFLQRMSRAHRSIREVGGYSVYKIDQSESALVEALTSDSELRRLVIRAEGYRILVASDDKEAFEKRLLRYGYLVS
ncbi:MAG: hypothetical protein HDS40_02380 [Bacteroides sp.]|nr:hypothetical protein [Bacteroides sp.]